jgi:hypothetical protein
MRAATKTSLQPPASHNTADLLAAIATGLIDDVSADVEGAVSR